MHPDAHACRLKISLATRGTPHGDLARTQLWTLRNEYAIFASTISTDLHPAILPISPDLLRSPSICSNLHRSPPISPDLPRYASYVAKWRFVSAVCRLTVGEEHLLLSMVDTDGSPALYNRRMFVRSLAVSLDGSPTPPISLRYPPVRFHALPLTSRLTFHALPLTFHTLPLRFHALPLTFHALPLTFQVPKTHCFDALGAGIYLGSKSGVEEDPWYSRLSPLRYGPSMPSQLTFHALPLDLPCPPT